MFRTLMLSLLIGFSFSSVALAVNTNPCDDIAKSTEGKSVQATQVILESCRAPTISNKLPEVTAENATSWADASKEFAHAIGIAAKELGIAVNDFLDSPAGWLLAAILVFNYMGEALIGVFIGVPMLVAGAYFWLRLLHAVSRDKVTYDYVPYLWGAFRLKRVTGFTIQWSEGAYFTAFLAFFGIFGTIGIFIATLS